MVLVKVVCCNDASNRGDRWFAQNVACSLGGYERRDHGDLAQVQSTEAARATEAGDFPLWMMRFNVRLFFLLSVLFPVC
jgi:hypothetical protein